MYNFVDVTDNVEIGGGSSFELGLNQNVTISEMKYQLKDGYESLNIEFIKDESKVYATIYKEKPGQNEEENQKKASYTAAVMLHLMKAYGTEDEARATLGQSIASFKELCDVVCRFIEPRKSRPIDIFLEYKQPKAGTDTKYLTMPNKMFDGYFLCPGTTKQFKTETSWDVNGKLTNGIRYVAADGTIHPFVRTDKYCKTERWAGFGKTSLAQATNQPANPVSGNSNNTAW